MHRHAKSVRIVVWSIYTAFHRHTCLRVSLVCQKSVLKVLADRAYKKPFRIQQLIAGKGSVIYQRITGTIGNLYIKELELFLKLRKMLLISHIWNPYNFLDRKIISEYLRCFPYIRKDVIFNRYNADLIVRKSFNYQSDSVVSKGVEVLPYIYCVGILKAVKQVHIEHILFRVIVWKHKTAVYRDELAFKKTPALLFIINTVYVLNIVLREERVVLCSRPHKNIPDTAFFKMNYCLVQSFQALACGGEAYKRTSEPVYLLSYTVIYRFYRLHSNSGRKLVQLVHYSKHTGISIHG